MEKANVLRLCGFFAVFLLLFFYFDLGLPGSFLGGVIVAQICGETVDYFYKEKQQPTDQQDDDTEGSQDEDTSGDEQKRS